MKNYPKCHHHAAAKSLQSCPTLCDPIDGSPPGPPVPGILQARTLEWVAIPSPMHESEKVIIILEFGMCTFKHISIHI